MIFILWIVFISLEQNDKLEFYEKVWENKDFCGVVMPSEDTKMLEFDQYQKSDKTPCIFMQILNLWIKK